jgi:hypothetical protein
LKARLIVEEERWESVAWIYSGREKLKQGCKYEAISPRSQGPEDQVVHLIHDNAM